MRNRLIVSALILLVLTACSHAGYSFKSVTTAQGGQGAESQNAVVQSLVEGPQARVEFVESRNEMMKKGNYVLTQDAGKTMYMVDPGDKTYMKWDIEAMMGAAGDVMKMMGGMVQMEFSEPKIEKLADEAGPALLGYPTRHYKFRTTFSTTMTVMGRKNSTTTVKEEEIWATPAITDSGMGAWLRKSPPKSGNEQLDKMIRAEMNKIAGFPLKQIMVNSTTDANGKAKTHTTTMEVTELKKVSVPASAFVLPPDYTEQKMEMPEVSEGEKPAMTIPPALLKMMQKKKQ
jgi:hypothetical protein